MQMRCAMRVAGIAYRLDLGVSSRIVVLSNTVDTAPKNNALLIDDEGGERDSAIMDMIYREGDRRRHELRVAGRMIAGHQACPWSLALSASFNQTTPTIMTASQNAWISVSG